ncbi:hypothetical protein [Rhodoluna sp.]|uniref:hypothetical protein n=1 Tax=Rhodoluna sp. TaxID=1969481 RepID=UPI0025D332AD|nr:hypothetical protein [Rhodoluna sp.]
MDERKNYPQVYIDSAQDSFMLQLEQLEQAQLSPAISKNALRNLALSLELHFVDRLQVIEQDGGALQDLRAVAALLTHDAKAPVALGYLKELVDEVFLELNKNFAQK